VVSLAVSASIHPCLYMLLMLMCKSTKEEVQLGLK
jgi:hypothetical protein